MMVGTTLIVLGSVVGYGLLAAITGAACFRQSRDRYDPEVGAVLAGLFWPVGLFVILGIWLSRDRLSRADRAAARQEVAERQRALHIRRLEIQAGVRCPHGKEWGDCYRTACAKREV